MYCHIFNKDNYIHTQLLKCVYIEIYSHFMIAKSLLITIKMDISLNISWVNEIMDFPGGSYGKQSVCNAGDPGLVPGLGRSPEEWNGYPSSILA